MVDQIRTPPDRWATPRDSFSGAVGVGKLVYTRNSAGRKILLAARLHSLSVAFQGKAERLSRRE